MAAPTFDLWDQAVLTDLINKPIVTQFEDQPFLGGNIAPTTSIQSRVAKVRVYETKAFGIGQFKAPDATPPLVKFDQTFREELIELALLEEMERISGEDWIKLTSGDEDTRRGAGVDLVSRGRMLQLRNERLTEWMRWQAFTTGTLTINYDGGASNLFINYGFDPDHFVSPSTAWDNTGSSTPIEDLKEWSKLLADDTGYYGLRAHMSTTTWDYITASNSVKTLLTETNRSLKVATATDVNALLREGTEVVIYDNGYRNEGATDRGASSLTRYLPENKVLLTTNYNIEGEKIADTLDGQVLVGGVNGPITVQQGSQSEVIPDAMSKNQFFRVASARIPRILHPECFLVATVWTP